MDGLVIQRLPGTKEIDGAKRWEEEKGEFVQISYLEDIRHLAFFEIKKGYFRGGHYHEKKDETFYVVRGKIRARFRDPADGVEEEHILERGDKISVKPGIAHIFYGVEDVHVVEYSSQYYDKADNFKVDFGE